jgi:hypothetical protein
MYFADPADQGALDEMRKNGLAVANNIDKQINTGIQVIKKLLKTPGSTEPKLFLAKETTAALVQEFMLYHFKTDAAGIVTEDPDTEFDHWLDALRYILMMLLGKSSIIMAGNGLELENDKKITDNKGDYFRAPNAQEFASSKGITFNDTVDTSKLGKIVNTKTDDPGDDDNNGGDGGFLWSF